MQGFNATDKENLQIWEEIAKRWYLGIPPWRPSKDDIGIYKKLCGKKLKGNVLILGATPELRDLVSPLCNQLTLVDMSPAMIERTTLLLKHPSHSNEIRIQGDWCTSLLPNNSFDLVVGDMPWWVLSTLKQKNLRNKIFTILKDDGSLVTRFRIRNPCRIGEKPGQVINHYLEELDRNRFSREVLRNAMLSYLYDVTVDTSSKRINRKKTKEFLLDTARILDNPPHKEFILEASNNLLGADWTSQTREEILFMIGENFSPVSEGRASDYESECYPIISFKKNV